MSISDRDRKLLWARSGNRCAICGCELVIDATEEDRESIVGEECHIVSGQTEGPRYDPSFDREQIHSYANMLILCCVHHKVIDDQPSTFTAENLRELKENHERKMSSRYRLKDKRTGGSRPEFLTRVTSGKELVPMVQKMEVSSFDHDELESESDIQLVGGLFDFINEWNMILDEVSETEKIRVGIGLSESLRELEKAGYWVFAGTSTEAFQVPSTQEDIDMFGLRLRVMREDNTEIQKITLDDFDQYQYQ